MIAPTAPDVGAVAVVIRSHLGASSFSALIGLDSFHQAFGLLLAVGDPGIEVLNDPAGGSGLTDEGLVVAFLNEEGIFQGPAEHLAMTQGARGPALTAPFGNDHHHWPGEGDGGLLDQAIGSPGAAMEEAQHAPAGTGLKQGGRDLIKRPIKITATTGHDHQRS